MQTMTDSALPRPREMYDALLQRDASYEGIFLFGVKTTGVFCRPTCSARKPKQENVEFFPAARDALLAGYRACKKCRPLEALDAPPQWLRALLADVEADPNRRWTDADLRARDLEPARVRRWFQQQHGMTFHAYQRARRLGGALGRLRLGEDLTQAGYAAGFESPSGFRDAFHKLFGNAPGRARADARLVVTRLSSPLGPLVAAATETHLCLLEFAERRMLKTQIDRLRKLLSAHFVPGDNAVLEQAQRELSEYFEGRRHDFDVPTVTPGTEFQQAVWAGLRTIPFGEVRSYAEQARAIGRPAAVRAVGKANGDNRLAIIVPCHRVIGANGELVGYGGQLWRKKALLGLEQGGSIAAQRSE